MKKYFYLLLLFFVTLFPLCTNAALLKISVDQELLESSAKGIVSVYLDSPGENINALSGEIVIVSGKGTITEIRDGDSIISAWIERPEIKENKIVFAGIIPGGFSGMYSSAAKEPQPGLLMKFGISTEGPDEVIIGTKNLQAYSGSGDTATIKAEPDALTISFSKKTVTSDAGLVNDARQPIFTDFTVTKLNNETKGWFAVFNAEDRDSGIDYFEIQETYKSVPEINAWHKVTSPYKLEDQQRRHSIFIKAVDRNGNEKIVKINPNSLSPYEQGAWGVALLIAIGIVLLILKRRRKI